MRTSHILFPLGFAGLLLTGACGGSQAHQVQEAEVEAAEKRADNRVDAIEGHQDAREDAIEQNAEADQERIDHMSDPPEELAEEKAELREEKQVFVNDAQAKLDTLEVRVNEAERKLQLKQDNSQELQAEVRAARLQIDNIEKDLNQLPTVQAERWDAAKDQVQQRLSELGERVELLRDQADG